MKKLLVLISVLLISFTSFAAIGTVDSQKVAQGYSAYKEAMEFLQKESRRLQVDLDARKQEYDTEIQKYIEKYDIQTSAGDKNLQAKLDVKMTEKEKEELTRSKNALETYFRMIQSSLSQQEADQMNKIRTDIQVAIKEIASQEGLEVILEKQTVVYGGVDVTQKVIDFLQGAEKIEL
jgi:Skp family chaperone for outer membrane proteins